MRQIGILLFSQQLFSSDPSHICRHWCKTHAAALSSFGKARANITEPL